MFDKLRGAFSSTVKSLGEKELKEKDVDGALSDLEIALLESDVAIEVIDSVKSDLKEKLIGLKIDKNEIEKFVRDSLISVVSALFDGTENIDLFERINEKKKAQKPFLILFVGNQRGREDHVSGKGCTHVAEGKIFSRCGSIRYI